MNKKKLKKIPKGLRPATRSELRQAELDHKKALEAGRLIYESWKENLMNTPTRPDELPGKLNELAMELSEKVKHPDVLDAMLRIVDLKISDTFAAQKTGLFTMKVHAICPNVSKVNNVEMICNMAFDTLVLREKWAAKEVRLECPQCGGLIHQKNMKLVQITFTDPEPEKN